MSDRVALFGERCTAGQKRELSVYRPAEAEFWRVDKKGDEAFLDQSAWLGEECVV
jgi:hypothetical protein